MKRYLLLGYVLVCVVLIGMILVDGLAGDEGQEQPSYYRTTADSFEGAYQAQTEAAAAGNPTSSAGHEGGGGGGGGSRGGGEDEHPSATPTPDPSYQATLDAIPTIED